MRTSRRGTNLPRAVRVLGGTVALFISMLALALPATAAAVPTTPYATLAPGFTQSLYATGLPFATGVAFARDGDPMMLNSSLSRVDAQSTVTMNGSAVHPVTTFTQSYGGL